jgi:hypothetical protein
VLVDDPDEPAPFEVLVVEPDEPESTAAGA